MCPLGMFLDSSRISAILHVTCTSRSDIMSNATFYDPHEGNESTSPLSLTDQTGRARLGNTDIFHVIIWVRENLCSEWCACDLQKTLSCAPHTQEFAQEDNDVNNCIKKRDHSLGHFWKIRTGDAYWSLTHSDHMNLNHDNEGKFACQ